MAIPRVLVLRAPGTNCDHETAFAFEQAGATADRRHINELLATPDLVGAFQILCLPGGFSYGDDVAAGRILGNQIRHHLADVLSRFRDAGNLILGICNGFQVLIKSGLLIADDQHGPPATLTWNDSACYQDLWVHLAVSGDRCVFLRGIEGMYLPVAHGEGKFIVREPSVLQSLRSNQQLALRYVSAGAGSIVEEPLPFPINPNGSMANVAGACDPTGRVFGLMPHPERHIARTHHPRWTRGEGGEPGDGFAIFRNAVQYFA